MSTLPTLYKKTSTGAIQEWTINVVAVDDTPRTIAQIVTKFGQVGGKIQVALDTVHDGKNFGKANETTPLQQAESEAKSQWEKKLKKGYVQTVTDAEAGKIDAVIEGGLFPMLAHRFDEQGHKIAYPAESQPKFDGHRCIATVDDDGEVTLWSRTRKAITGLPHINAALKALVIETGMTGPFDGELYNHAYKDRFEELSSFIRSPGAKPGYEVVQYHIYDLANEEVQAHRTEALARVFHKDRLPLVRVETIGVGDEDDLMLAFERFLAEGYEGAMVRNREGMYVNKRSYDLQKVKEFADAEFMVVGVEEGRGKLAGHAIFVCKTAEGTEFRAKMKGATEDLKAYFEHPETAIGKELTVKYQGITNKNKVPRFPVALRFATKL